MTDRHGGETASWPERPWVMAGIGAAGGLAFEALANVTAATDMPAWRQAAATFVVIATISFVLTVEPRRWRWSAGFAAGWGLVVAMIGWFTARYNQQPTIFEFPFFSGLFAVLLAAPLFQTARDEGAWRFPYDRLYWHAWIDAVIGAASLAFVGVTFLLSFLIAGLFDLIGIDLIKDLLDEGWFAWMLAGFAFGGAVGLLRERDGLVETLQRLVTVVLSVLAPVLAAALALFLLSLPFTGLGGLWDSDIPATPMMLLAGAGAILLANAVIGNGRAERAPGTLMRRSAQLLVASVLPLAGIAAMSLGQRIGQHGWTPERIWGVVAVLVAVAYGAMGWWSLIRGRDAFDDQLRPLQTRLALGLCGLALMLALPIIDFGAISARSQIARLEQQRIAPAEFDYSALAFDFGPAGRRALDRLARAGPAEARSLAAAALKVTDRWQVERQTANVAAEARLERSLRLLSPGLELTPELRRTIVNRARCEGANSCALLRVDAKRVILLSSAMGRSMVTGQLISLDALDSADGSPARPEPTRSPPVAEQVDLATAPVEIRDVKRRQLFVDGQPVGEPFE